MKPVSCGRFGSKFHRSDHYSTSWDEGTSRRKARTP